MVCAFLAFFDAAVVCGSLDVAAAATVWDRDALPEELDEVATASLLLISDAALRFLFPFWPVRDELLTGEAAEAADGEAWLLFIATLLDVIAAAFIGLPRLLRLETGTWADVG